MTASANGAYAPLSRRKLPNRVRDLKNIKFGDRGADTDPELEVVVGKILDSGMSIEQIARECEKIGHPISTSTITNWIYGGTKRPQNFTMTHVMRALGYEKQWIERNSQ